MVLSSFFPARKYRPKVTIAHFPGCEPVTTHTSRVCGWRLRTTLGFSTPIPKRFTGQRSHAQILNSLAVTVLLLSPRDRPDCYLWFLVLGSSCPSKEMVLDIQTFTNSYGVSTGLVSTWQGRDMPREETPLATACSLHERRGNATLVYY